MAAPHLQLAQAIEQFRSHQGLEHSDSLTRALDVIDHELTQAAPERLSAGQREAQKAQNKGTDGTGEHYSLPRGPDQPSPGQKEAISVAFDKAAHDLAGRAK